MAGGFNFSIDFDSSAFKRGSDQAADSVDQLGESLERIERSDTSPAEQGVEDIGTAARGSASDAARLADEFDTAFNQVRQDSRRTRDEVEEPMRPDIDTEGPLTKSQDLANELRASLGETMGELASSFAENGLNMEDAIEGVIEVASETAQSLPGPWAAATQAMIVGASAVYGEWKKTQDRIAENASAMYQDMLESGADFLSDQFFQTRLSEFFDPMGESYQENMDRIKVLEDLGVPVDQAARALVGYGEDTERVMGIVAERWNQNNSSVTGLGENLVGVGGIGEASLGNIALALSQAQESTDTARRAVNNYRDSIDDIPTEVDTDVRVGDNGSIGRTQRDIENIRGASATVDVYADTSSADRALGEFRGRVGRPITVPITAGFAGAQAGRFYP